MSAAFSAPPVSGHETDMMMMSVRAGLALVVVLGLILLTRILLMRLQNGQIGGRTRRLGIVEQMMVDGKNRLLLIRRDQTEHLLMIGPEQIRVIETAIKAPASTEKTPDGQDHTV